MTEPKRHRAITRLLNGVICLRLSLSISPGFPWQFVGTLYTPMLVNIFLRVQGLIHPKPVSGVQLVKQRKIVNGAIVALEWKAREAWVGSGNPLQTSLVFSTMVLFTIVFCLNNWTPETVNTPFMQKVKSISLSAQNSRRTLTLGSQAR